MIRKTLIIAVLMLLISSKTFPQKIDSTKKIIQYGGNSDFFPYEYLDKNLKPDGFTIDLLKSISKQTGLKIKIELKPWNNIMDSLRAGEKYDLTSLYFSKQRSANVDFCEPFLMTYDELFIRKDENDIKSMNDLRNKSVAVEKEGFIDEYIKYNLPHIKVIEVPGETDALKLVNEGIYDAAIVNNYAGELDIKKDKLHNIYSRSIQIVPREYGFAVRKNDKKLLSEINAAVIILKKNGMYYAIYKKWFMYDENTFRYKNYFIWATAILLLLAVIAGIVFLLNKMLKKEVKKKTKDLLEELEKRKIVEMELLNSKKEVEKLSRIKSEFLSLISHEIRTPVNIIQNNYDFLNYELEGKGNGAMTEIVNSVKSATKRLIRTIDLIINFADVKTGTYNQSAKELDIEKEIIDNLIRDFKPEADKKSIKLTKEVKTKNCKWILDEYSVRSIFENLIDNAIKYTDKGEVTIIIEDKDGKLRIRIKDSGRGISKKYLDNLFLPFTQEEQGYTRRYEGNGLGLSLTYYYCLLNKADISVDSNLGVGSEFTIVFN